MPTAIASRRSAKFAAASVLLLVFAASTATTVSAAGTGTGTGSVPPPSDIRGPLFDAQSFQCEQQVQATAEALVQCTLRNPLWAHMVAFQNIADSNPGPDGFASRNIGEPGYLASALYVAQKMSAAGYSVHLQEYTVPYFNYKGLAHLTAIVQPASGIVIPAPATATSTSGCSAASFSRFAPGRIALIQRGTCSYWTKVHYAELAGAVGVLIFNDGGGGRTGAFRGTLSASTPVGIPVGMVDYQLGLDYYNDFNAALAPTAHLDVQTIHDPVRPDYNVIADSPRGDPNHVVVVEGHLDAIYGAGMLDSASGSATMLEVGLKMARTSTLNQLRYVWFGGEELGLYGSQYYVNNLTTAEVARIVFDIDSDVTATPNDVTAIADPVNSGSAGSRSPTMIQASQRGTNYFREYFQARGLPYVV